MDFYEHPDRPDEECMIELEHADPDEETVIVCAKDDGSRECFRVTNCHTVYIRTGGLLPDVAP